MTEGGNNAKRTISVWPIGVIIAWLMLLATMIVLFTAYGMRVSCTGSLPIGLYQAVPGEIELGSIVEFCPDLTNPVIQAGRERGYLSPGLLTCEGGIAPLLKYILALPGDWVEVSQENLRVNGHAIEKQRPASCRRRGTANAIASCFRGGSTWACLGVLELHAGVLRFQVLRTDKDLSYPWQNEAGCGAGIGLRHSSSIRP